MQTIRPRRLVAVLANPPLVTSGARSIRRVALAAQLLGCGSTVTTNLFPRPSPDVASISELGACEELWRSGQVQIAHDLAGATDVLLGWGCTEPTGRARAHHRAQVAWLLDAVNPELTTLWTVGGSPRHPSRWQRHTSRAYPQLSFTDALARALMPFRRGIAGRGDDRIA